jgi:hypothetical protein
VYTWEGEVSGASGGMGYGGVAPRHASMPVPHTMTVDGRDV